LVGFFYLLKLTCKVCNDGVVDTVLIEGERINEFGILVAVVVIRSLFDESC
jgi:hypothetical protein